MKYFFLFILLIAKSYGFTVVHYNIKELTSEKLIKKSPQVKAVLRNLNEFDFDILSVNEMQYDFPRVPDKKFKSKGKNLSRLAKLLKKKKWNQIFAPANTGKNAKTFPNGTYAKAPDNDTHRAMADQDNFGVFPGQYSTGGLFRYPIIAKKVFTDLKWLAFNPNRKLTEFARENGNPYNIKIELFDKNFTDVTVKIEGRPVHLIFFHAVPAFGFGNPKTPNFARNHDQMRFLEWYLTGSTDFEVPKKIAIAPLTKGESWIAMGDFNTDFNDATKLGSLTLKNLILTTQGKRSFEHTYIGDEYSPDSSFKPVWDYILVSKDLKIQNSGVYHPPSFRDEHGCNLSLKELKSLKSNVKKIKRILRSYKSYNDKEKTSFKICHVSISKDYDHLKQGSDHLPIWAEISF